jgi:uncharacterized protein YprB with RNaseH-like and TPR domain
MKQTYEYYSVTDNALLMKLRQKKVSFREIAELMPKHTQDSLRNHAWELRQVEARGHWSDQESIGFFDLETSNLKANIGILLSWAIKYKGGKVVHDLITKRDILTGMMDKRIVKSFLAEIKNVDVLVGYYSTKFDVPFARTRAMMLGLVFPAFNSQFHHDVYYSARNKLCLHSKRLDAVAHALGSKHQKTPLDISVWQKAQYGDKKALGYVLEHNIADVQVLEEVFDMLRPHIKMERKSI